MTRRDCPECGGTGRVVERMDKCEIPQHGSRHSNTWESRCAACRGHGYTLFGETYPTARQFQESYREWMEIEIIPAREAEKNRREDPEYLRRLDEIAQRIKGGKRLADAKFGAALEAAIETVRGFSSME